MPRKHSTPEEETEINITPMLDIVFIMLIFFIVTTSFVKETGIEPTRPQAETAEARPRGNILIGVDQTGDIWINKREVEVNQIRQIVEDALTENPESSAVIIADQESPTGTLIDIMDQVRLGGVVDISVAAEPEGT
ncbi:ExbD/TolR family protein [Lentisalinibacter sediminis]|uniref:ExbD/TolR family protein n=1 Tax=Lentisalinibacter sediminis TaxID=2992237 RepID=UPI00386E3CCF